MDSVLQKKQCFHFASAHAAVHDCLKPPGLTTWPNLTLIKGIEDFWLACGLAIALIAQKICLVKSP
jgi:hypothetical protein